MKNKIYIIAGCLVLCVGVLLILYASSPISKDVYRATFSRTFAESKLVKINELDAEVNSFYIAGITSDRFYFGNLTAPFHLLVTNHNLLDSQHIRLNIALDSIKSSKTFRLAIDSPYFFLTHGTMPEYLRGNLGEWTAYRYLGDSADYSVEALPIGPNSLILKSVSTETHSYELAKKSKTGALRFNNNLLNKQIDGLFCLDGFLLFDKIKKSIVYIHFYRNEYIMIDSNLNLLHRGHTIDTFSHARLRIQRIRNTNESMVAAPAISLNSSAAVSNNFLFIRSNVLSNSESLEEYLSSTVIDVYSLDKKKYMKSFYIPNYKGEKVKYFNLYNNILLTITGNYIVTYSMPKEII